MREQLPRKLLLPVKAAYVREAASASISGGCLGRCFCQYKPRVSGKLLLPV